MYMLSETLQRRSNWLCPCLFLLCKPFSLFFIKYLHLLLKGTGWNLCISSILIVRHRNFCSLRLWRPDEDVRWISLDLFFVIEIHSIQGWIATTRHGVTTKRSAKRLKHTGILFRKTTVKRCLLILDLKPLRS